MNIGTPQKNRTASRHRVFFGGVISFKRSTTTINCTVRDLSASGACLRVASPVGIPNTFDLRLNQDDDMARHCQVVWRSADRIGVRFVSRYADGPRAAIPR